MNPARKLHIVRADERPPLVESRVVGIQFSRRDEHEFRSIMAWRKREHPAWSQFWSAICAQKVGANDTDT